MLSEIKIKYLDWDSDFFGYKIGAVEVMPEFSDTALSPVVEAAKAKHFKLIYIKSSNNHSQLKEKKTAQFEIRLADERLTYSLPVKKATVLPAVAPCVQRYMASVPDQQLIYLALQSGAYSRFAMDPNFTNQEFTRLYTAWIIRIVAKEIPEELWVSINPENKLAGFVTVGYDQEEAYMGLIAVHENYRRTGIAHSFIQTACTRAAQAACTTLRLVTQKANLPACRLYEKSGFVLSKTEYLYHLWLR